MFSRSLLPASGYIVGGLIATPAIAQSACRQRAAQGIGSASIVAAMSGKMVVAIERGGCSIVVAVAA